MITRRTKVQLVVFVIITLLGVSFVGAKYARLDRLVRDDSYTVTAHFPDSGGAFTNSEVAYRGVRIGKVSKLELTDSGVDVSLEIDKTWDQIPSDSLALVADRSAVGEQYVDLEPRTDSGPFLHDGSQIEMADTETPIATDKLLTDITTTTSSVDRQSLRTTVSELGKAFAGTGQDLQRIIDTGMSFIKTANANFDTTARLIDDSNTVLNTQLASDDAIHTFARQLSLFSNTLADRDGDLRTVIDDGSFAANQLRGLIEDNRVDLGELLGELVTTGRIVVKNIPGIQQVLVIYPYVVQGGFTVVSKSPTTGLYDAHFGMIINSSTPCTDGYPKSDQRSPQQRGPEPMDVNAGCTDPPTKSNPRGGQNAPANRPAPTFDPSSVVASFDPGTGKLTWGDHVAPSLGGTDSVAPRSLGKESWKWLYVQPMTGR